MLSRRDQVPLGWLRLGHCHLNSYLYKIGCHPTGFCETRRKPKDLNHLFLNYPLYEGPRRHLVQNVGVMGIKVLDLPGALRLMNQKHPQLCKLVLNFLKECGKSIYISFTLDGLINNYDHVQVRGMYGAYRF